MRGLIKINGIILASILLMSSGTNMSYSSNVYSLPVPEVFTVLGRGNFSYNLMSTRNEKMADFVVYYEVLQMNHHMLASSWINGYSINYKVRTTLYKNVAYANGAFGWFTEHGNTKIVYNRFDLTLNSLPSDLLFIHKTTDGSSLRVCYPLNNFNEVNVSNIGGNSMTYYCNQETYYTNSVVSAMNYNSLDVKNNVNASTNFTTNANDNTFSSRGLFYYPNTLMNGEMFDTFGTLSFATNFLPSQVKISFTSEGVISEGSSYGECRKNEQQFVYIDL